MTAKVKVVTVDGTHTHEQTYELSPSDLNPDQFPVHTHIDWRELQTYTARDFDGISITEILVYLRDEWGSYCDGTADFTTVHPSDAAHNGPDNYIASLKTSIRKNGFECPLIVTRDKQIINGHHRAVAAIQMQHSTIPLYIVEPTEENFNSDDYLY